MMFGAYLRFFSPKLIRTKAVKGSSPDSFFIFTEENQLTKKRSSCPVSLFSWRRPATLRLDWACDVHRQSNGRRAQLRSGSHVQLQNDMVHVPFGMDTRYGQIGRSGWTKVFPRNMAVRALISPVDIPLSHIVRHVLPNDQIAHIFLLQIHSHHILQHAVEQLFVKPDKLSLLYLDVRS
ncbi:hypothetical protein SAMN02745978_02855 [Butyricicoccus pullicaecorum DSM 23266]|uniref:Uncharacterized protein n=1 Tax=Butyricicoccus pullicaecorum 1.2 TaxID=1203606 RepID=R8VY36_9FIRM|nr:hypothetical protein HMPREF1526_02415 [Butyricicoccus pullicaecorum 1.2]SKA66457.1 hypothetical protein SAMN02745978_02855 [Butyricicoccus pullicaecorum DSM 23266]